MVTREPVPLVTTLSFLGGLFSLLNLTWLIRWVNTKFFERKLRNFLMKEDPGQSSLEIIGNN
jgi:hypothetical protein